MATKLLTKSNGLLLIILFVAAFLRLYKISEFLTFLGDEGRDVLVVYNILHGHLTLLGPTSSVGGFFLGPIYYYLIAPFLLISNYDPVGPALMIALFGILTVYFIYYIGKQFFGEYAGLTAAALYSVSPLVVIYSKSSWNPNMMPIITLALLYSLYIAVEKNKLKYFLLCGILFGIAMQLHYIEVFIGLVIIIFVGIGQLYLEKKIKLNLKIRKVVKNYLIIALGFIIGFSPFLLFEFRHGFENFKNIFYFIFYSKNTGAGGNFFAIIWDIFTRLFERLLTAFPTPSNYYKFSVLTLDLWQVATIILAFISVFTLFKHKNKLQVTLLATWLFASIVLFGFYKKPIYDYYLEFMFPLPFLLFGNSLALIYHSSSKYIGKIVSLSIFILLFYFNISTANPLTFPYNNQKEQAKKIAEFVYSKTNNKPFNFALITGGNSDHAYRYYFTIEGHEPITIENPFSDPSRKTVTDQLFVVCESLPCSPLGTAEYEIAGFGRADIANHWKISVVEVYKLVHYKPK